MPAAVHALDEARVLGDEAPAGPDRVGARAPQRVEHAVVVEIGRDLAARRVEPLDGVGVAHEGRVAIDVGVERDHPQLGALVRAQRLHGADAAHRRLAAVHDGEPADRLEDVHVARAPAPRFEGGRRGSARGGRARDRGRAARPRAASARRAARARESRARRARSRRAPPRRRGRARARPRRPRGRRRGRQQRERRAARRARGRRRRSRSREAHRPLPQSATRRRRPACSTLSIALACELHREAPRREARSRASSFFRHL